MSESVDGVKQTHPSQRGQPLRAQVGREGAPFLPELRRPPSPDPPVSQPPDPDPIAPPAVLALRAADRGTSRPPEKSRDNHARPLVIMNLLSSASVSVSILSRFCFSGEPRLTACQGRAAWLQLSRESCSTIGH